MPLKKLSEFAEQFGLELSEAQIEQFSLFETLLYEANETKNLTRIPREDAWHKHFLDSLSISPYIPKGNSVLDIGTGPGMPGVCLAIARPDLEVALLDSAGKEIDFLHRLCSDFRISKILQGRAEELAHEKQFREAFDVVTGRALAPANIQLELSAPFAKLDGILLPMRTGGDAELLQKFKGDGLGILLEEMHSFELPPSGASRLIPVFRKVKRTHKSLPRIWAAIKQKPLD